MNSYVEHPWRKSKSENVYCRLNDVLNEIRPNLIVEDKYVKEIGEFSYKVQVFEDNVIVFRERSEDDKSKTVCKICAQNGYLNVKIRWQKRDGKWIAYNFDNPTEPHTHLRQNHEDI
jgi:hypothetical protein